MIKDITSDFLKYRYSFQATSGKTVVDESDLEAAGVAPEWLTSLNEVKTHIDQINKSLKELELLHECHSLIDIDSDSDTEKNAKIDAVTGDITRRFRASQKIITGLGRSFSGEAESRESILMRKNVQRGLAAQVQDCNTKFRELQARYIRRLKEQEARIGGYYGADEDEGEGHDEHSGVLDSLLYKSRKRLEEREESIKSIVHTLVELSDMMTSIATMIADQGTMLDRIDCNMEEALDEVGKGVENLTEAERLSRKIQKMNTTILILIVVATGLLIGFIIKKFT
ncbi:Syntaxin-16 like protein [Aduncisulcus paluster]|uniref:Syntaxin-16 like protein n=1 Tax=Aduncisulcus paluster TaxID=2918883 RepID=A0ABQ5JW66_9EUKA|nr:Syntaxin-16 like protein [Aduncisulcus paluster]